MSAPSSAASAPVNAAYTTSSSAAAAAPLALPPLACCCCHVTPAQRCVQCKVVAYCGKVCQMADWKAKHSHRCKKLASAKSLPLIVGVKSWGYAFSFDIARATLASLAVALSAASTAVAVDAELIRSAAASYLRLNYRLRDLADDQIDDVAALIRRCQLVLAKAIERGWMKIDALWLDDLIAPFAMVDEQHGRMQIFSSHPLTQPRFRTVLPCAFVGSTLSIGGTRSADQFVIDVDARWKPDMLADGVDAYHLMALSDAKFAAIVFEFIAWAPLWKECPDNRGNLFRECYRCMRHDGTLTFKTPRVAEADYTEARKEGKLTVAGIRDVLESNGFTAVEVELKRDFAWVNEEADWFYLITARKQ